MAKYMVLHTFKRSADEFARLAGPAKMGQWATVLSHGSQARCLRTWNPYQHGRKDYVFCLWEATSPDAIRKAVEQTEIGDFLNLDVMQVDEIDWSALAAQAHA